MPFVFFFLCSVTNRLLGPKTHASLLIVSDKGERTWLKKMVDLSSVVLERTHKYYDFFYTPFAADPH